jgi:hypothetical protein
MIVTAFWCNDMEEAWIASICAEQEREQRAMERDEDLDAEAKLGREAILAAEEDGCDPDDYLPDYAPRPYEVCYPEVFSL